MYALLALRLCLVHYYYARMFHPVKALNVYLNLNLFYCNVKLFFMGNEYDVWNWSNIIGTH